MPGDEAYVIFLGVGILWTAMGIAAVIGLLKSDNQPIRFGKWGLIVAIPIVIPFIAALVIGTLMSFHSR